MWNLMGRTITRLAQWATEAQSDGPYRKLLRPTVKWTHACLTACPDPTYLAYV